jgi:hypothetical protein
MFTRGFKTAAFDHNNQGLEFKMSDPGQPNVGPGGMSPSGVPSYQPVEEGTKGGKKLKRTAKQVAQLMYKISAGLSDSGGSDIASTTVDQLKWTSQSGPTLEEEADDRKALKNRRKAYIKARLRE